MRVALVVPSFARPTSLATCLASALAQDHRFDEIVVAARAGDSATTNVAATAGVLVVTVEETGVLAAMSAAVRATTSDIVGFTDDDALLPPSWSSEVLAMMTDARVGGVGGRDVLYDDGVARVAVLRPRVGVVTWYGRIVGNHHCGTGPARDVDVLKGVNSAYRRTALALPTDLRGDGAQAHFEISCGRDATEHGWRLVYDPAHTVAHSPARRVGEDQRLAPSDEAVAASAFNAMRGLPRRLQTRRLIYVALVGDGACPGIARSLVALVRRDHAVRERRRPAWSGSLAAWRLRKTEQVFTRFS